MPKSKRFKVGNYIFFKNEDLFNNYIGGKIISKDKMGFIIRYHPIHFKEGGTIRWFEDKELTKCTRKELKNEKILRLL